MTNPINLTQISNTTDIYNILQIVNVDFTGGFYVLFVLIGFLIILFTNFGDQNPKDAFLVSSFFTAMVTGLFWLAGFAPTNLMIGSIVLVFISILIYFLFNNN